MMASWRTVREHDSKGERGEWKPAGITLMMTGGKIKLKLTVETQRAVRSWDGGTLHADSHQYPNE